MKKRIIAAVAFLPTGALAAGGTQPELFAETKLLNEDALILEAKTLALQSQQKHKFDSTLRRDFHPKAHGCIKGSLTVPNDVPINLRYGVFAKPSTYKVWARASSGDPKVQSDNLPDIRGFAFKVIGVAGARLLEGDTSNTADFLLVTSPVYPTADLVGYNKMVKSLVDGTLAMGKFAAANPGTALGVQAARTHGGFVADPLETQYWTVSPIKHGPNAVKYTIKPCTAVTSRLHHPGSQYLRAAMKAHLEKSHGCFDVFAQTFVSETATPIENYSVEWKTSTTQFLKIARLEFPVQTFDSSAQNTFCENLSFNPWHTTDEHRPLGNLNRARRAVYEATSTTRHLENQVVRAEPTGDETF